MDATIVTPKLYPFSKSRMVEPPRHLGTRYDRSGTFLPEPGNTVVCHLVEGSETQAALVDARARYLSAPETEKLAFTPISSLHMTLFQGVIEYRRQPDYWPPELALDTTIPATTAHLLARLADFEGGPEFKVRVVDALPTGLTVEGATPSDRQALTLWRDRLADRFGYRHPDHDTYVFHITFAYPVAYFVDASLPVWQTMLAEVVEDIARRAPVLDLKAPAFCRFEDMNHFEELLVLPFGR
ncbi:DUF1868 domain-containing protein [Rhizobium halophytocola]|uniref:DUF1868 domain-containing protein n=1 Tax=Rhizobium halophytocola TaxID=735519 RepID=A0ABS4E3Y3_9HYPH|nr:DUF1868 domain-containing protein [Rhizobium halophytocola]MBP1852656.1 hypothetical protein [Rhizobium halophytocola]